MALYVNTEKCAGDAPVKNSGDARYEVGVALMVLGQTSITEANVGEVLLRWDFYSQLTFPDDPAWRKKMRDLIEASKGMRINGVVEPWGKWTQRIAKNFRYDFDRRAKAPATEAA